MQEFSSRGAAQMLGSNIQRNREFSSLVMVDQNLHENISTFMLRQIAIVRQMVYNMLRRFDVTKNLAMGSTNSTSPIYLLWQY